MTRGFYDAQTEEDFNKAHSKALFNEIQHLLKPEETKLIPLNDMKTLLKPTGETYVGMRTIPTSSIVGSEGRYQDFDNGFLPKNNFMRDRWRHVDEANLADITLPPIKVYELAGLYFVRDGNHRVSVAKSKGVEFIDADVVSLQSEIKLRPTATMDAMVKQIIGYEKRIFYSETGFGDVTDYWALDFTTAGQYDVVYNHILTHKYYLGTQRATDIEMDEAIMGWFKNVYQPIIGAIDRAKLMKHFRGRTYSDLYVWIIKRWDDLKAQFGQGVPLDDAVSSVSKEYHRPFRRKVLNRLQKLRLLRSLT